MTIALIAVDTNSATLANQAILVIAYNLSTKNSASALFFLSENLN